VDRPRVLVVGDVIDDLIVQPQGPIRSDTDTAARITPSPGGSGANQATWLAAAGVDVRFAGRVATRDLERHRRVFAEAGVEAHLSGDAVLPTGTIVVLISDDGHRTMFTDRGANVGLRVEDLPDALLDGVALIQLSGYALFDPGVRGAVLDLVARARANGIGVAVDPSSTGFLADVGVDVFLGLLGELGGEHGVELLLPNLDEALLLAGTDDPDEALARLLDHAHCVVITLGSAGVLGAERGGTPLRVDALPVHAVDPTGAGDAFAAGFVAARLTGAELAVALGAGVAHAAQAVVHAGARPQPPPQRHAGSGRST
jgi:sugar/nucleoside kinase (ribokinase family)